MGWSSGVGNALLGIVWWFCVNRPYGGCGVGAVSDRAVIFVSRSTAPFALEGTRSEKVVELGVLRRVEVRLLARPRERQQAEQRPAFRRLLLGLLFRGVDLGGWGLSARLLEQRMFAICNG